MIDALQLFTFAHAMRKETVSHLCAESASIFQRDKVSVEAFLAAVGEDVVSSVIDAQKRLLQEREQTLAKLIRDVMTHETALANAIGSLSASEIAAEKARYAFSRRIKIFESYKSPDEEIIALNKLRKELVEWVDLAEMGADEQSTAIIKARSEVASDPYVEFIDGKIVALTGALPRIDAKIAKWIGYNDILQTRESWSTFEDRLPAFVAERRNRILDIDVAIAARNKAFREAMRSKLAGELNVAMKGSQDFEVLEDKRAIALTKLFQGVTQDATLLDDVIAAVSAEATSRIGIDRAASRSRADASTVDRKNLGEIWIKAEKMTAMTKYLRGHLAFEYQYAIDIDGNFAARYRGAEWTPTDLFEEINEATVSE